MEENAEITGRLERIGVLTREGAPRPELLAAIRSLIAAEARSSAEVAAGTAGGSPSCADAPPGGGASRDENGERPASHREEGVAVS